MIALSPFDPRAGRLVDFERSSANFRDISKAGAFIAQLKAGGIEGLTLVRFKDRLNQPLVRDRASRFSRFALLAISAQPSGYRDLMCNFEEPASGMVCELQIALEQLLRIKSQAHKVCAHECVAPSARLSSCVLSGRCTN